MSFSPEAVQGQDIITPEIDFRSILMSSSPIDFLMPSGLFLRASIPRSAEFDESNMTGFLNEQRVGMLVSKLPYVKSAFQTVSMSENDAKMIDLVVEMIPSFPIAEVFVQVKSSKWGIASFFDHVGKIMREESGNPSGVLIGDDEYKRRLAWLKEKRLIVVNAGVRSDQPVGDDYILEKFNREVREIVNLVDF